MSQDSHPNDPRRQPLAGRDESTAQTAAGSAGRLSRLEKAFFLALFALILVLPLQSTIKCHRRGLPLIGGDGEHYYAILHSFVFHHNADLSSELFQLTPSAENLKTWMPIAPETGRPAEWHTVGWAVVAFVPYVCVHACYLVAGRLGCGPAIPTGYELPYQIAAGFAHLLTGWLGLIFSYRLCRRYFAMWPSMMAVVSILFGSALFNYCTDLFMAHISGFFAVSVFLYYCAKLGDATEDNVWDWVAAGLAAGLMVIMRQTNGVFLLVGFYPFWSRLEQRSAQSCFALVRGIAVAGLAALPLLALQSLFWHGVFGRWFVFSYQREAGFFWTRPQVMNYLFAPTHGLLFSSPVMALAALGLLLILARRLGPSRLFTLLVCASVALLIYTNSAWHAWSFGCGFGSRGFVDASTPEFLGMAALFSIPGKPVRYTAAIATCLAVAWTCLLFAMFLLHYITGWGDFTFLR